MRHNAKHALIILTASAILTAIVLWVAPSSAEETPHRATPTTTSATTSTTVPIDYQALGLYLDGLALSQYLASLPPPVIEAPAPVETPTASGTGACGGATNGADQYIGRETFGSADPVNQANLTGSGAWGCYQIMPDTWAASCSDLGPLVGSDGATQAQCASRLPLSAWGGSG